MIASAKCLELIRKFEGLRLTAYLCPAGVATIGYGHTKGVGLTDVVTESEAIFLLTRDVADFEDGLSAWLDVPVTQGMFDALVSFAFNLGLGALHTSSLFRYVLAGEKQKAADEFPKWCHAGGKVLPGLVKRREAERELFLS